TENFFRTLIMGDASYQLYFIPTLLIFYFMFPLIHTHVRALTNKWLIILLGLLQISLLYYDYFIHPLSFYNPINIALLNFFIFFAGVFASHHRERLLTLIEKWKLFLLPITVALAQYIFYEGKILYLKTHNYLMFYSQWRPSVLFYTISLSGILYYFLNKDAANISFVKLLSRLSFFVFFIHVII